VPCERVRKGGVEHAVGAAEAMKARRGGGPKEKNQARMGTESNGVAMPIDILGDTNFSGIHCPTRDKAPRLRW
jgi:hypothetical protein